MCAVLLRKVRRKPEAVFARFTCIKANKDIPDRHTRSALTSRALNCTGILLGPQPMIELMSIRAAFLLPDRVGPFADFSLSLVRHRHVS
jgi:hypothetical protein